MIISRLFSYLRAKSTTLNFFLRFGGRATCVLADLSPLLPRPFIRNISGKQIMIFSQPKDVQNGSTLAANIIADFIESITDQERPTLVLGKSKPLAYLNLLKDWSAPVAVFNGVASLENRLVRKIIAKRNQFALPTYILLFESDKKIKALGSEQQRALSRIELIAPSEYLLSKYTSLGFRCNFYFHALPETFPEKFKPHKQLDTNIRLLVVGSVQQRKGLSWVTSLAERAPDLRIDWAGRDVRKRMDSELFELTELVNFIGPLSKKDLYRIGPGYDGILLVSEDDPFPFAISEFMLAGYPVIVSEHVGHAQDGVPGILSLTEQDKLSGVDVEKIESYLGEFSGYPPQIFDDAGSLNFFHNYGLVVDRLLSALKHESR